MDLKQGITTVFGEWVSRYFPKKNVNNPLSQPAVVLPREGRGRLFKSVKAWSTKPVLVRSHLLEESDPLGALFPKPVKAFFLEEENTMALLPWFKHSVKPQPENTLHPKQPLTAVNAAQPAVAHHENQDDQGPNTGLVQSEWLTLGDVTVESKARLKRTLSDWLQANPEATTVANFADRRLTKANTPINTSAKTSVKVALPIQQPMMARPLVVNGNVAMATGTTVVASVPADDHNVVPFSQDHATSDNHITQPTVTSTPRQEGYSNAAEAQVEKLKNAVQRPVLDERHLDGIDDDNTSLLASSNKFLSQSINNLAMQYFKNNRDN